MAHFAKLTENNQVLGVEVVDNSILQDESGNEIEQYGIDFLVSIHGWPYWKQTSYNTRNNIYYVDGTNEISPDQSKAFRKNFASVGDIYLSEKDAFVELKPYDSFILNETSWIWQAPVDFPTIETYTVEGEEKTYAIYWHEPTLRWKAEDMETPQKFFDWNADTLAWVQT
mgnify:CR=1 FL=1|tara:strand:+ start:292 stop:801 length:510 start_codon:yes stop_codon:yes gene_type:complete